MERLELFIDKLRNAGYSVSTNWEVKINGGKIQSC